jgi:ATP-dependent DNA helicase Q4
MEAVLSYLEADDAPCLRMLPATALSVKVSFYSAAPETLAPQYPVVQAVLEACPNPRNGLYSAAAARLAAVAQKAPGLVLQELRNMAAGSLIGFELSREEGLAYEILQCPTNLDALAQQVHDRLALVLGCQVARLDASYRAMAAAVRLQGHAQEAALREAVERYFDEQDGAGSRAGQQTAAKDALQLDTQGLPLRRAEPALLQAARAVLRRNREQGGPTLTARALARILHGVGSPAFAPDAWGKRMGAFWGSQSSLDFAAVLTAAEIVLRDD